MIEDRVLPEKTMMLSLRDQAMRTKNKLANEAYRDLADEIYDAVQSFTGLPSELQMLNGLWAKAIRLMKYPPTNDPGRGGHVRIKSIERVAA